MPIRSLLSETSFNTEQTELIAKAFDDAWDQVKRDGTADGAARHVVGICAAQSPVT